MSLHLCNSLLLVFMLTKATLWAQQEAYELSTKEIITRPIGSKNWPSWGERLKKFVFLFLLLTLVFSGPFASLANLHFPVSDWQIALKEDFSPQAHPFVRWRITHPLLGILLGAIFFVWSLIKARQSSKKLKKNWQMVALFVVFTFALGWGLLIFHSPPVLRLLHLGAIYLLWVQWIKAYHEEKNSYTN